MKVEMTIVRFIDNISETQRDLKSDLCSIECAVKHLTRALGDGSKPRKDN